MFYLFKLRRDIVSIFTILFLIALLTGCNENPPIPTQKQTPELDKSPVGSQANTMPLPNPKRAFEVSGLLYIESTNFQCPLKSIAPNTLVLSTERLNYDSVEIQQMTDFADSLFGYMNFGEQLRSSPSTLQWTLGSSPKRKDSSPCGGVLEITNIGKTRIQISQIALRLVAVPQQNTYHYRLVDICSFRLTPRLDVTGKKLPCPRQGTAGGSPVDYNYQFELNKGKQDGTFYGNRSSMQYKDAIPTLELGQAVSIKIDTYSIDESKGLIYDIIPELTLDILGEQRVIQLTQLQSKIFFSDPSQLSCYGLTGNTFILLDKELVDSTKCL